jgi:hypothetical protein
VISATNEPVIFCFDIDVSPASSHCRSGTSALP